MHPSQEVNSMAGLLILVVAFAVLAGSTYVLMNNG